MIPLFRRHFWITLAVFVAILLMGQFLARFLTRMEHRDFFNGQAGLFQAIVDRHPGDRAAYVDELNAYNKANKVPVILQLVPLDSNVPEGRVEVKPGEPFRWVKRLPHVVDSMLVIDFPPPENGPPKFGMAITLGVMFLCVGLASALSLFLLFRNFREKAELAKDVIGRLQHGDLKARFPATRWDEAGQLFLLFNQMAGEIERLVEKLKDKERARVQLLQELAHDLRTPVASLKSLLESLHSDSSSKPKNNELLRLAFQESEYLGRLVEDLLLLALMFEPKYKTGSGDVQVQELIQSQMTAVAAVFPKIHGELSYEGSGTSKQSLTGSPHLLKRLVRNALENAYSFARSKVDVTFSERDGEIVIIIRDDGPGLNAEALENFGKKRPSRYQDPSGDGRISVGLGSVIMQAIAGAHGGNVSVANVTGSNGQPIGAQLTIVVRATGALAA